jgi:predicted dinucleotide-binding enzyme
VKYKIVIVGCGAMGGAIAEALLDRTSHGVSVRGASAASRSATSLATRLKVGIAGHDDISRSDIVIVATPREAIPSLSTLLSGYRGIIVSVIVDEYEGSGQKSSAEQLADVVPSASVTCAFTTVADAVVRDPGNQLRTSVFVFSDHQAAKVIVRKLAEELGFGSVNGGSLASSLYGEALGMLVGLLAANSAYGNTISFHLFRAEKRIAID